MPSIERLERLVRKIETDSILIKAKRKHLTKMSDRVSKVFCRELLKHSEESY
jgi:hypothetical protein